MCDVRLVSRPKCKTLAEREVAEERPIWTVDGARHVVYLIVPRRQLKPRPCSLRGVGWPGPSNEEDVVPTNQSRGNNGRVQVLLGSIITLGKDHSWEVTSVIVLGQLRIPGARDIETITGDLHTLSRDRQGSYSLIKSCSLLVPITVDARIVPIGPVVNVCSTKVVGRREPGSPDVDRVGSMLSVQRLGLGLNCKIKPSFRVAVTVAGFDFLCNGIDVCSVVGHLSQTSENVKVEVLVVVEGEDRHPIVLGTCESCVNKRKYSKCSAID